MGKRLADAPFPLKKYSFLLFTLPEYFMNMNRPKRNFLFAMT